MKVESIQISNFKSIGVNPPLKISISDITVLTGTNDTGKTSVLSASYVGLDNIVNFRNQNLKLISQIVVGSKHFKGFTEEEGSQMVIYGFKCTEEEVSLIIQSIIEDESLKKQLEKLALRQISIDADSVKQFISEAVIYFEVPLNPSGFAEYDDFIMYELWHEGANRFFGNERIDDFSLYLLQRIASLTSLERSIKNSVCLFVPSVTRSERIFLDEKNSDKQIPNIVSFFREISSEKGRRNGDYSKFMDYCKILFPDLERVEINTPEGGDLQEDLFLTWKQNGIEKYQPLSRSGGGVYNTLFLLVKLINNYNNINIAFIDEPEIGLHPMLQQRFIKLLRKLSREFGIQWIVSTHSPFLLQNLKDKEKLYLIEHDGTQTNVREVAINKKEEVFLALGAYLPLTFASKGVLFVEGQTEVTVLQILLSKVGFDIEKEQLLIIPLGGENLFKIDPKDLKRLHEKSMVILDSDLTKTEEEGGNIKKIKSEYGQSCHVNGVGFVMHKDYRTLENLYPKDIMAELLKQDVSDLTYGYYDVVPGITDRNKVKMGEMVASEMSIEQASEFPLIKEIITWW